MSYVKDYEMSLRESKLFDKEQELLGLEKEFGENSCKNLSQKISEGYDEYLKMPMGWKPIDTRSAILKRDQYQSISDNFNSYEHTNNHQYWKY